MNDLASELAALHRICFATPRPWSADEFRSFLADPSTVFVGDATGFALGRVILDEAELLTIAAHPDARRRGLGTACLTAFQQAAIAKGAATCFLEVAATNAPAIAMYKAAGFSESGLRKGYYLSENATKVDAVIMTKPLSAS